MQSNKCLYKKKHVTVLNTVGNCNTMVNITIFYYKIIVNKIKQSHYRPEVPRGFQKLRFPDYVTMDQNGGKVVSLKHWPFLPPENTSGTHFC